jgi:hypothetical protein
VDALTLIARRTTSWTKSQVVSKSVPDSLKRKSIGNTKKSGIIHQDQFPSDRASRHKHPTLKDGSHSIARVLLSGLQIQPQKPLPPAIGFLIANVEAGSDLQICSPSQITVNGADRVAGNRRKEPPPPRAILQMAQGREPSAGRFASPA